MQTACNKIYIDTWDIHKKLWILHTCTHRDTLTYWNAQKYLNKQTICFEWLSFNLKIQCQGISFTFRQRYEPLYHLTNRLNTSTTARIALALNNPRRLICYYSKKLNQTKNYCSYTHTHTHTHTHTARALDCSKVFEHVDNILLIAWF